MAVMTKSLLHLSPNNRSYTRLHSSTLHSAAEPPPRKPLSFSGSTPRQTPPPSRAIELNEIRQNLSEFRLRSAAPPPSSSGGGQFVSLQELYNRTVKSKGGGSAVDPADRLKHSFNTVRESLNQFKSSGRGSGGKAPDPSSLARLMESLKLNPDPNTRGSYSFPSTLNSGKRGDNIRSTGTLLNFLKFNDYLDLGKKLKKLRPEKRKGKWFSLQELNERLIKVREIEDKKSKERSFIDPRDIFKNSKDEKSRMQKTAEKLKLELKNVRDEFKMSESDCGSARVQVAQLTKKIKYLSSVLQKKDKHSRRGLQAMVPRRKKLLKYLRRTDWDSYCLVLSKLGHRDNPDIKA